RYKATKARQAQSRLKQIDKIKREGVEAEQRDRRNLRFSFVKPERPGRGGLGEPASGSVRLGHNVKIGYLSQHADTAAGEGTVLDAAQRETGLSGQKARDLLGGFLFSGADVEKSLDDISGGEQR